MIISVSISSLFSIIVAFWAFSILDFWLIFGCVLYEGTNVFPKYWPSKSGCVLSAGASYTLCGEIRYIDVTHSSRDSKKRRIPWRHHPEARGGFAAAVHAELISSLQRTDAHPSSWKPVESQSDWQCRVWGEICTTAVSPKPPKIAVFRGHKLLAKVVHKVCSKEKIVLESTVIKQETLQNTWHWENVALMLFLTARMYYTPAQRFNLPLSLETT